MTVYVDEFSYYAPTRIRCFKSGSAHLTADSLDELHAFADKLGLRRVWFQASPPSSVPHYDLTKSKHTIALQLGAVLVPAREQARRRIAARRPGRPVTCVCDVVPIEAHDSVSSWMECKTCGAIWDLRDERTEPEIATTLRNRCRATQIQTDMPVPSVERCVFVKKHDGRHKCPHGFHWRQR